MAFNILSNEKQKLRKEEGGATACPSGGVEDDPLCVNAALPHDKDPEKVFATGSGGSLAQKPALPTTSVAVDDFKYTRRIKKITKERRIAARASRLNESGDSIPVDQNPFSPIAGDEGIGEDDGSCKKSGGLRGKAKALVKHLGAELGLKPERELPDRISCGELRPAVRSVFGSALTVVQELSIKTSMKVEKGACKNCLPRFEEGLKEWAEARYQPTETDDEHVARFKRTLRANVPRGWNGGEFPYIPNGSGTSENSRLKGGNWNKEEFSDKCRAELVFSSGKPRVVTLYSEFNTRTLSPLHNSLFSHLQRKGWLLVGPPTDNRVKSLTGGGCYRSVDYKGATDNIKSAYVRASIDVLKEQASPALSVDQERCLDVLGNLQVSDLWLKNVGLEDYIGVPSTMGQPMGSVMSFPLLCLVNKTVVDLALTDLVRTKEISFKEWTSHRCLINGDDLLTKEPR